MTLPFRNTISRQGGAPFFSTVGVTHEVLGWTSSSLSQTGALH
jgi:hypothetical protein